MKRLLYLAALVVVATLTFAPAALAQQETDLSCDTEPPQPGCEEGGSPDNSSANPNDPAYFYNDMEQNIENKLEDLEGLGETGSASGDVSSDALTRPVQTSKWWEWFTWIPDFFTGLWDLRETWQDTYDNAANRY